MRASTQGPVTISDGLFLPVVSVTIPIGYNGVINLFGDQDVWETNVCEKVLQGCSSG